MTAEDLFNKFSVSTETQKQAIFASIFIIQNRLQTVCDDLTEEISMKQWLLLAMTSVFPKPPTLTAVGKMLGCSRQNIKKLAVTLEKKGFLKITQSSTKTNAANIILDKKKVEDYDVKTQESHNKVMDLLFQDFNEEEIAVYYECVRKLYNGVKRVERMEKDE